jgi:hypothetical protein
MAKKIAISHESVTLGATGVGNVQVKHLLSLIGNNLDTFIADLVGDHELAQVSKAVARISVTDYDYPPTIYIVGWINDGVCADYNPGAVADLERLEVLMNGFANGTDLSFSKLGGPALGTLRSYDTANTRYLYEARVTVDITKIAREAAKLRADPLTGTDIHAGLALIVFTPQTHTPNYSMGLEIEYSVIDRPMRTFARKLLKI